MKKAPVGGSLGKAEKMIEVTNLTKKYGSHLAVNHLSFRVEKGQIYGFLGPNGAGKSTTMNILTGYIAASEGTVTIDGKDILKEPEEAKKRIGYLPELPPLYADMTVEEYLTFAAELKKVPKKDKKTQIEQVMEMTQITDMRQRLIKNLSKGYRQRVGLAQAILGEPEVIILDEPTVGLDPKQIIEIRDLIRKLGENHTVILSSHILSEVSAVCDHIMIISHGKLVASDSPAGLQRLMSGSAELLLTVKGSYEQLTEAVAGVESIEAIERIGTEKTDDAAKPTSPEETGDAARPASAAETKPPCLCTKVKILARDKADIREEVFFALAKAQLPILEMAHLEKSLEDIFLELTENTEKEEPVKRKLLGGRSRKRRLPQEEAQTADTDGVVSENTSEDIERNAAEKEEN